VTVLYVVDGAWLVEVVVLALDDGVELELVDGVEDVEALELELGVELAQPVGVALLLVVVLGDVLGEGLVEGDALGLGDVLVDGVAEGLEEVDALGLADVLVLGQAVEEVEGLVEWLGEGLVDGLGLGDVVVDGVVEGVVLAVVSSSAGKGISGALKVRLRATGVMLSESVVVAAAADALAEEDAVGVALGDG
jgi:hypothetical protein